MNTCRALFSHSIVPARRQIANPRAQYKSSVVLSKNFPRLRRKPRRVLAHHLPFPYNIRITMSCHSTQIPKVSTKTNLSLTAQADYILAVENSGARHRRGPSGLVRRVRPRPRWHPSRLTRHGTVTAVISTFHTFSPFPAEQHDSYHIGESLIPSVRHYLRFIDAEEKVASHGFARKVRLCLSRP